ncbi:MAG TPA: hypothetical protein VGY32_12775, partial [Solirubrobacteraceae bacterium]|nr:hypothetical protein [Solirubrobacteraceae bacterium]
MRGSLAGATGAIGRELLPKLIASGHEVAAMSRGAERTAGADPVVCDALDAHPPRRERPWLAFLRRHWWIPAAVGLLIVSLLIVLWAGQRPGYDPYGWLVWGKLTLKGALDTNGAPSWKPLPFLFTVPFSLFGYYSLWLWMVFAVAVSLAGLIFAWRIAFRLTKAGAQHRYAAHTAGLFAALFVAVMQDVVVHSNYTHYALAAESDTMIVTLVLAAVDLHLIGRDRWAFWMWWLAGLGRPEVWPFLGAAGIYLWLRDPAYRWWLYGALAAILFLWFVIPGLSSKSFFTAGNIAHNSPRAVKGNKVTGTISRYHALLPNTVWVLASLTVVMAAWRRWWRVLAVAAVALVWLIIEIGFSVKGYPSVPRYMYEGGAIVAVLAAVFIGRLILEAPPLISRVVRNLVPKIRPRLATQLGGWGAAIAVVAIAGSMFGAARTQIRYERLDLRHERARTKS